MILDCGCGSGRSYEFSPRIFDFLDTVYLDIERPYSSISEYHLNWVVADAELLPFRNNSFDKIVASHLIEHLNDPMEFIFTCYRLLKDGGELHIITPNFMSKNTYLDPNHKHVFNFIKLHRLLKRYHFRVHFGSPIGSRMPKPVLRLLKIIYLLICEELYVIAEKVNV